MEASCVRDQACEGLGAERLRSRRDEGRDGVGGGPSAAMVRRVAVVL
jgi:hypothetical protein